MSVCRCDLCEQLREKYNATKFRSIIKREEKIWRLFPGEWCPSCNSCFLLIFTSPDIPNGFGFDNDPVECLNCGFTGVFKISDSGNYVKGADTK